MLAKAGESDRAIKVKMVRSYLMSFHPLCFLIFSTAQALVRGQTESRKDQPKMKRTFGYLPCTYIYTHILISVHKSPSRISKDHE